jgi:hypothetical protein
LYHSSSIKFAVAAVTLECRNCLGLNRFIVLIIEPFTIDIVGTTSALSFISVGELQGQGVIHCFDFVFMIIGISYNQVNQIFGLVTEEKHSAN